MRRAAVDFSKNKYGEAHSKTIEAINKDAMSRLIIDFQERDMIDEALNLQKELVEMRQAEWGDAACETIWAMQELSDMFRDANNEAEAIKYSRKALDCAKKRGAIRKQTIYAMEHLSEILDLCGEFEENLALLRELVAASTKRFGENNPHTIKAIGRLAQELSINGDAEGAALQKKYDALVEEYGDPDE